MGSCFILCWGGAPKTLHPFRQELEKRNWIVEKHQDSTPMFCLLFHRFMLRGAVHLARSSFPFFFGPNSFCFSCISCLVKVKVFWFWCPLSCIPCTQEGFFRKRWTFLANRISNSVKNYCHVFLWLWQGGWALNDVGNTSTMSLWLQKRTHKSFFST